MRLDKYLVEQNYFESRNRAHHAIKIGQVIINGKLAKPSAKIDKNTEVEVLDSKFYVSRAARKLEDFLAKYPIDFVNKRALDIGSSTGGFAQIVLEKEAKSLTCVDVGSDQLHMSLRANNRVILYEKTDIRDFASQEPFDLITCDVAFISILKITQAINSLASDNCDIIILYKPQFEVGKNIKRDSKGVVADNQAISAARVKFESHAQDLKWKLIYMAPSAICGKDGNQEYLYYFTKHQ